METVLSVVCACIVGAYGVARVWRRLRSERREAIDIDAVIDAKYPNRTKDDDHWLERDDDDHVGDIYGEDDDGGEAYEFDFGLDPAQAQAANAPFQVLAEPDPEPLPPLPAPPSRSWAVPVPVVAGPAEPLPGEPDGDGFAIAPPKTVPQAPAALSESDVGDPFDMLRTRRDRIASQVAEAFREVHNLRTEALRRASQAEHNASLATNARTRAGRMVRETRAVEAQGRQRPEDIPSADDAFEDVHRFRTEALKRAQQAEHGAHNVSQARERASRLLAEQREIEAEMARLQRLRNASSGRRSA